MGRIAFYGIVYFLRFAGLECDGAFFITLFTALTVVVFVIRLIVECVIGLTSCRGSVLEVSKRECMVPFLYVKLFLWVCEVFALALFTYNYWFFDGCDADIGNEITVWWGAVITFNWLFVVSEATLFYCFMSPFVSDQQLYNQENTSKLWGKRLSKLFCCACLPKSESEIFMEIGNLLGNYVKDVDLVPSDIAAALVMLNKQQEKRVKIYEGMRLDVHSLEEISHYTPYMLGVYGWPLYIFSNIGCGCCNIITSKWFCPANPALNMSSCNGNYSAMMNWAQGKIFEDEMEIIYVNFENGLFKSPFCVIIDHRKQKIIVSIRGTLSIKDCVVDCLADKATIDIPGFGESITHRGIYMTAKYVYTTLKEERILKTFFRDQNNEDYDLLVIGHSLGAGVATLLTILLQKNYPDVKCIAYSPPGALVEREASLFLSDTVQSIFYKNDLIPRLSLLALEKLKRKVLHILETTNSNKGQIFGSIFCGDALVSSDPNFRDIYNESSEEMVNSIFDLPPLYPAGVIIHLIKDEGDYIPYLANIDDFDEIIISKSMMTDHLPQNLAKNIIRSLEQSQQQNFFQ